MNEIIESINQANITIDSNSAVQIAELYLQYKYIELAFTCGLVVFTFWIVSLFFYQMMKNDSY